MDHTVQLTLEQYGFELHTSTYTPFFPSVNIQSGFCVYKSNQSAVGWICGCETHRYETCFYSWIMLMVFHLISYHQTQGYIDFSVMFSSRNFIALNFTFRYMIHLELIFMKGIRSVSVFVFWLVNVQLFQHHLLSFSPWILYSFVKNHLTIFVWVYFRALYSAPLNYVPIPWPLSHSLDCCSLM